jgi:hypothetical protein
MKLIYHDLDACDQFSPFDKEIVGNIRGKDVSIVCPYIGLKYIEARLRLASDWKIVTDVGEWLSSQQSNEQRILIKDFIVENTDKIRHIPSIHAKVVITNDYAFLGSANLTDKGICKRIEMSVSLDEPEKIRELSDWFNSLWERGSKPERENLEKFIRENPVIQQNKTAFIDGSTSDAIIKSRLINLDLDEPEVVIQNDHEIALIDAIRKLNQNEFWINQYFDLIKDLFDEFGVTNESQKIAMVVRKDLKMTINIGQRYVIYTENGFVSLIMPLGFRDILNDYQNAAIIDGMFYDKKQNQEALWVEFDVYESCEFDSTIIKLWKTAVAEEFKKTKLSGFRKYHNPAYFKTVMDKKYREETMGKIFQK